MKYDNLAFVIALVGFASAAPYMTRRDASDRKFEPLTTPASSPHNSMVGLPAVNSPNYACSIGPSVHKNTCRTLLKNFVAQADHGQHQGMSYRRDVHLAAGEKTPILTYSASAGDRRSIKLSRRSSAPSHDDLNHEDAPASKVDGCSLDIFVDPHALKNNRDDGLPMSQEAATKAFYSLDSLVDHVESGGLELLQNCASGGVSKLEGGVVLSISPPQTYTPPQYRPNIPKSGTVSPHDPSPLPIEHKRRTTSQVGNPPMAHEPESAQPPTHAQSGLSPMEQQTPEAAHEDATPKSTSEAGHEATLNADNDDAVYAGAEPDKDATDNTGDDDAIHADAKSDEDVIDNNDAAAEDQVLPETPAAGTGISEEAKGA